MGLNEENQEGEFHSPILGINPTDETCGTEATNSDGDLYVGRYDMMVDVKALYANTLGSDHQVFSTGNEGKQSHHIDVATQDLAPPTTNTNNAQSLEVSDASGIIKKSFRVAIIADPIDPAALVADPPTPVSDLPAPPADEAIPATDVIANSDVPTADPANDTTAVDPTIVVLPADPIPTTVEGESRVGVSETSTNEERSDPSLG